MSRLLVPRKFEDVTPFWITEAFHSVGNAEAKVLDTYPLDYVNDGKGFMNRIARFKLVNHEKTKTTPNTVIIKLSSLDPDIQIISNNLSTHTREVRFYQELSVASALSTPHQYYSSIDQSTGDTVLIMEDIDYASPGDSIEGCSYEDIQGTVKAMAKFHANWWQNPSITQLSWLPSKIDEANIYTQMYDEAWTTILSKSEGGIPKSLALIGQRLSEHIVNIKSRLSEPPITVIHGDFRPDNCFYRKPPLIDNDPIVFDWEFCARSRGPFDLATFICESLPHEQRLADEMNLVKLYHATLTSHGVDDYSLDECLTDYRLSILDVFIFWVVVGAYCDFGSTRARRYFLNAMQRFDHFIRDLDSTEVLGMVF